MTRRYLVGEVGDDGRVHTRGLWGQREPQALRSLSLAEAERLRREGLPSETPGDILQAEQRRRRLRLYELVRRPWRGRRRCTTNSTKKAKSKSREAQTASAPTA